MAKGKPILKVILQPRAETDLWEIWEWNAKRYGYDHAEEYEAFLKEGLSGLATGHDDGKAVLGFSELQSLTIRRNRRGDGHIVIYEIDHPSATVHVHHIFHTKMDIGGRLNREREP